MASFCRIAGGLCFRVYDGMSITCYPLHPKRLMDIDIGVITGHLCLRAEQEHEPSTNSCIVN